MTLAYVPPGVNVQELTSTSVSPLLAIPGSICLVGMSSGVITRTDTIQLSGTTTAVLPGVPAGATLTTSAISSAMDALNPSVAPSGFIGGTDYTFSNTAFTLVRIVTSQTIASNISQGASTLTLSSGAVPAAGQVIRLTNGSTTETAVVQGVVGQVVTITGVTQHAYITSGTTVTWGTIPDGDTLYVTYSYTPVDYYQPIRLTSMGDIQTRFGPAWDPTGTTINSPLSFAASMAFQNGASNVVLQPLYFVNASTGVRQQPNATQAATASVWSTTFNGLLDLDDINLLVPVVGQSDASVTDGVQLQILEAAQDFVYQMGVSNSIFVDAVFGEDSTASSSEGQESTITAHAQTLQARYAGAVNEQLALINTSQFSVPNATSSLLVGGQYAAAAIAGMLSARSPSSTLTRQAVSGLLSVTDLRTQAQKNADASNSMLVLENKGNVVQVRHGITMDSSSVATREMNVVRAKQFIIESVSQTLDSQVVGQIAADADAETLVNNVVIGVLEDLRGLNMLQTYTGVQSAITSIDPTTMLVQFTYVPLFVINYVVVQFALDLTAQSITVSSTTQ